MIELSLDVVLAFALMWLAWRVQRAPELFTAVVLYIVFGLVMALAWVRLAAPDIALAEAALGAGVTGALLLDAARQLGTRRPVINRRRRAPDAAALVLAGSVGLVLASVVWTLDRAPSGLAPAVVERLDAAGVSQPVTAVLLTFRAYDTWLETMVLLVAALGALALRHTHDVRDAEPELSVVPGPLHGIASVLVPVLVLVSAYLLWLGTRAPGGAFQAGAVLGSAAILTLLAGVRSPAPLRPVWVGVLLVAGVVAFTLLGVLPLLAGSRLLEVPAASSAWAITIVETAVAVAVALTLFVLFLAARPVAAKDGRG